MDENKKKFTLTGRILSIVLPVCLIASGVAGFQYFKSKEEKMKRRPPKQQAVMVETMAMNPGSYQSTVKAMGTVVPDKQILLKAKVSGEIVSIANGFVEGGLMKKGDVLLTIDDSDFQIEVKKAKSALDKALSDLKIEQGSQKIAKEELKLINQANLGDTVEATELSMRKPQLVQAKAAVDSARADLEMAKLNLSRTRVKLPFNALVLEKMINLGSIVTSQSELATLVDIDAYRIEALVPPDKLNVINISDTQGSRAVIHSRYSNQSWEGRVVRTTGQMTSNSRMAGVIVLVDDPLGLNHNPKSSQLLLQDHVELTIMGQTLDNVFSLSRAHLRDDDTVWIYNNGKLVINKVELAWKEDGVVYVSSGIKPGDELIISDLPAPVRGMSLQTAAGNQK